MADLPLLYKLATDAAQTWIQDRKDLEPVLTKMAQENHLSQEAIHILVGHTNKKIAVFMNDKIASGDLPMGAIFPAISPDKIIVVVRKHTLEPGAARAIIPPNESPISRLKDMIRSEIPVEGSIGCSPPTMDVMKEVLTDPSRVVGLDSREDVRMVRDESSNQMSAIKTELSTMSSQIQTLNNKLEEMISEVVKKKAPAGSVKQALLVYPHACEIFDKMASRYGYKMDKIAGDFEVNQDHPIIKIAARIETLRRSSEVLFQEHDVYKEIRKIAEYRLSFDKELK